MRTTWRRFLGDGLAVTGLVVASFGALGVTSTHADGGKGDIKIHLESACLDEDTNPQVDTTFWVGGHSFDTTLALYLTITLGMHYDDPKVYGTTQVVPAGGSGDFCVGPFSPGVGHYKAYVSHYEQPGGVLNHEKTKVFWVLGPAPTTAPPNTAPPTTPGTTVPGTIPQYTSGTTTTSIVASEAPVPGAPTTSVALPVTGQSSTTALFAGLVMLGVGVTLRGLARRTT